MPLGRTTLTLALAFLLVVGTTASAQSPQAMVIQSADGVLREIVHTPGGEIPYYLLENAQGIAIVPGVVKLGFVVGVRHGRGVLLLRDPQGKWTAPQFIGVTGGSFGWQAGIQAADLVLIFKTRRSVEGLMGGKLTLGADASVAAGPVGRQAAAATDATLQSEIYSYSRSRGLFAGVALDGSVIHMDTLSNAAYYRGAGAAAVLPPEAQQLINTVTAYTAAEPGNVDAAAAAPGQPAGAVRGAAWMEAADDSPEALRRQLAVSGRQLHWLLDEPWKRYLALPAEISIDRGVPRADDLAAALQRYEVVRTRPEFQPLAQRPEFQQTYDLLRRLQQALAAPGNGELHLPPPPGATR